MRDAQSTAAIRPIRSGDRNACQFCTCWPTVWCGVYRALEGEHGFKRFAGIERAQTEDIIEVRVARAIFFKRFQKRVGFAWFSRIDELFAAVDNFICCGNGAEQTKCERKNQATKGMAREREPVCN